MYFFPPNGATLNDSLCFFMYHGISFQQSGKVSSDLCYFQKVKINTKRNRKLRKTFFYKSRNYCGFLFPQNGKCYTNKLYFHKMQRLHYFEIVENTRGRNLKMCLFSMFIYIFDFIPTKWKKRK